METQPCRGLLDAALVEGFRLAFYAGAVLAILGVLTVLVLIRANAAGDGEPCSGHAARG
jgi:hypothetical protein